MLAIRRSVSLTPKVYSPLLQDRRDSQSIQADEQTADWSSNNYVWKLPIHQRSGARQRFQEVAASSRHDGQERREAHQPALKEGTAGKTRSAEIDAKACHAQGKLHSGA